MSALRKKLRNQEIYMEIASGKTKQEICAKWNLSLTQLNRILREANEEADQWYKSLPRQTMIQIFHNNSAKVFQEIQTLEQIRNGIKDEPETKFAMTIKIINAYSTYNRMVADGPSLIRQKEVVEASEKSMEKDSK